MSFCLYNKKNITWPLEDMNFIFCGKNNILLTRCTRSQNMVLPIANKIHIFAPRCNVLYIIVSVKRKGGANIQNNC